MRTVQVVEVKAKLSSILAAVEAGEEIAITRRGRVVARLVPESTRKAADLFRAFWEEPDTDLEAPPDQPPGPVKPLD
ncbi:MAG: type II toxin-antitoxin system prevent-host-death family antitoxin [Gammaproteobacteria bacterium]|nr:type II toxin-antitoxin system prevent-host-death family antitoxin [Gammaproteobacteria bacterium]